MKKKILAALVASVLIISASACGNNEKKPEASAATTSKTAADTAETKPAAETYKPAADIVNEVLAAVPINSAKDKSKEKLADYFDGIDLNTIEDSSMYVCASGSGPDEIAVLRFKTEDDAKNAVTSVMNRLIDCKNTSEDYPIWKDQMYKFDDAAVVQEGVWVYYIITSNNAKAEEIIKKSIS